MSSRHIFLLLSCLYVQGYAAILKKSCSKVSTLPIATLAPSSVLGLPSCGLAPLISELQLITPVEVPTCGCSAPLIEVPRYFSPAVEVPSCGCAGPCGCFSAAVELASCGCGVPSCSCSSLDKCGCSVLDVPAYYYSPPLNVCSCGTSPCSCGTTSCGCGTTPCGCGTTSCGCGITPCGCGTTSCGCDSIPSYGAYLLPAPTCGCGVPSCGCAPLLPPLPPVLGCGKYLRQVCVQPPFL